MSVPYNRDIKKYKINEDWGIRAIKITSWQGTEYAVEVFMLGVPWEETVDGVWHMQTPDEANQAFKNLVEVYKQKTEMLKQFE